MEGILLIFSAIFFVMILGLLFLNIKLQGEKEKLERAKSKAENANNAKSEFISNMSLEIRTQLNSIVGFSEDIQSHKENADPKIGEDADYVLESSKRLLEIIDSILDINNIENKRIDIKVEPYHFNDVIESIKSVNTAKIANKNINLIVNSPSIPYELIGDVTHIKEIVHNMFMNAVKHTEQGEIELNVKCNNVEDNCILNISINNMNEKEPTDDSKDIELTIAKTLVEMMGGKYSNLDSTIEVEIPQKIGNTANANPVSTATTTPTPVQPVPVTPTQEVQIEVPKAFGFSGKKVLIVDDNQLNIKVARKALEGFEFSIDECTDGQECLNKVVNGNEYDLILMDIMMPNMSGEAAMAKLRENPKFNIPTIALTADADSGAKEKYLQEGFVDYIAKPFSKEQIEEKLNVIFNKKYETESEVGEVTDVVIGEEQVPAVPPVEQPQVVQQEPVVTETENTNN